MIPIDVMWYCEACERPTAQRLPNDMPEACPYCFEKTKDFSGLAALEPPLSPTQFLQDVNEQLTLELANKAK